MIDTSHAGLVIVAKSFGLVYLVALSIGIVAYAFWPSLAKRFDRAANSIIEDEDKPVFPEAEPREQRR